MANAIVLASEYRQRIAERAQEILSSRAGRRVQEHLAKLAERAKKLNDKEKPSIEGVAGLTFDYAAVIGVGISFHAPPQIMNDAFEQLVDNTFGSRVRIAAEILRSHSPRKDGDLAQIVSGGMGLDFITQMLGGENAPVATAPPARVRTVSRSDNMGRDDNLDSALERYIPLERCIPAEEYKGFAHESLVGLLGYANTVATGSQIGRIRRSIRSDLGKTALQRLGCTREYERVTLFDFRNAAYFFIRSKNKGGGSAVYTSAEALKVVETVLTLEGVKPEFIKPDAQGILKLLERDGEGKQGSYNGHRMCKQFLNAAKQYYASLR